MGSSWGMCAWGETWPGVWARVHFAMEWVNMTLAENTGPPPAPPTRGLCPDFAAYPDPDRDGDCMCPGFQRCSTDGGDRFKCPTSGIPGDFDGRCFLPDCEECVCYEKQLPTPESGSLHQSASFVG